MTCMNKFLESHDLEVKLSTVLRGKVRRHDFGASEPLHRKTAFNNLSTFVDLTHQGHCLIIT